MFQRLFIQIICVFISLSTYAQSSASITYKVRQIQSRQNLIVVEASRASNVSEGSVFIFSIDEKFQCDLPVASVDQNLLVFDSRACEKASLINLKTNVEPSLSEMIALKSFILDQFDHNSGRNGHLSLTLGYSYIGEFNFDDSVVLDHDVIVDRGSATFKTGGVLSLGIGFLLWGEDRLGLSIGGYFQPARPIKSISRGTVDLPNVAILGNELNAVYRWTNLYAMLGVNYIMPVVTGTDMYGRDGFGQQVGIGYVVNGNSSIEFMFRRITFDFNSNLYLSDYEVNFGRGAAYDYNLSWRYNP